MKLLTMSFSKIKSLFSKPKEVEKIEKKINTRTCSLEKGSFVYCSFGPSVLNEDFGIINDIIDDQYIIELQQQHKGKWIALPKENLNLASRC
jgi:hypothetical protein